MGWHSQCCSSQRRRKPRQRHSSPLLESSCPKPSPAGQARPATSIHTCAPNVRPFSSRSPHKEDLVLLRPRRQKYSAGREDRRFCEENPGEDGHTCGSRCTLEQLATARVPHLDWLALPDHCFTAAKTAKRTQKQALPTRATKRSEMLWAQRVHGSARRLSCTLEWSERSARD